MAHGPFVYEMYLWFVSESNQGHYPSSIIMSFMDNKLLKLVSLIYSMVSEINISLDNMLYSYNLLYKFREHAWYFDKYAMKNKLQNKMQITCFPMASKNIDVDHVCHVIVYRLFIYSCT